MDPRVLPMYFSTDVELDGPDPRQNSMMSIGVVAYRHDGVELGRFYANLLPLPEHAPSPYTTEYFWKKLENQSAWAATQTDQRDPVVVMRELQGWMKQFSGKPTLVASPLRLEDTWLSYYFIHARLDNPFECKIDIGETLKNDGAVPYDIVSKHPYNHNALDDAIHQGETFMNYLALKRERAARNRS